MKLRKFDQDMSSFMWLIWDLNPGHLPPPTSEKDLWLSGHQARPHLVINR